MAEDIHCMAHDTRIENPILNSPFEEPARHFRFDEEGITPGIVEARRPSSYFVPIPQINHCGDEVMKVYEVD